MGWSIDVSNANESSTSYFGSTISPAEFRSALSDFPSGVTVVTTLDGERRIAGFTASAFSSLSLDPALVLICPALTSATYPLLVRNRQFAIHILAAGQQEIAMAFASKGNEKTASLAWELSNLGNPVLPAASCILECMLWREYEGGDHAILVGEVKRISRSENGVLLYHRGKISDHPVDQVD